MKSKGFTLIELLAVIVILAIIALIATPIIINIINNAREQSYIRSAELYLNAAQLAVARTNLSKELSSEELTCSILDGGNLNCAGTEVIVELKNSDVIEGGGTITFVNGKITEVEGLIINGKTFRKVDGKLEIVKIEEIPQSCFVFEDIDDSSVAITGYTCDYTNVKIPEYKYSLVPISATLDEEKYMEVCLDDGDDELTCNRFLYGEKHYIESLSAEELAAVIDEYEDGFLNVTYDSNNNPVSATVNEEKWLEPLKVQALRQLYGESFWSHLTASQLQEELQNFYIEDLEYLDITYDGNNNPVSATVDEEEYMGVCVEGWGDNEENCNLSLYGENYQISNVTPEIIQATLDSGIELPDYVEIEYDNNHNPVSATVDEETYVEENLLDAYLELYGDVYFYSHIKSYNLQGELNDWNSQFLNIKYKKGAGIPIVAIGDNAFENNTTITSVTIPNGVTTIGDYAFGECVNLTSVTLPNTLTSIGRYGFGGTGITTLTLPTSVTTLGRAAFGSTPNLTTVSQTDSVTNWGDEVFCGSNYAIINDWSNNGCLIY